MSWQRCDGGGGCCGALLLLVIAVVTQQEVHVAGVLAPVAQQQERALGGRDETLVLAPALDQREATRLARGVR